MSIEGKLSVDLYLREGVVDKVTIGSTRPVHASRVLVGKTPHNTLKLVPLLYSICGTAQACASVTAIAQALKVPQPKNLSLARNMLVWMETAREHLWRVLIDWPKFIEEKPQPQFLGDLTDRVPKLCKATFSSDSAFSLDATLAVDETGLGNSIAELERLLETAIFEMPAMEWLESTDVDVWSRTCNTQAARLLRSLAGRGWSNSGLSESSALPALKLSELETLLSAKTADNTIALPTWNGACFETTPLSRINSAKKTFDSHLQGRLLALLTELASIPNHLWLLASQLHDDSILDENEPLPLGVGISQVEAARGRLIHRVTVDNGLVASYQILAPTEWNFHPNGVLKQSLLGIQGDEAVIKAQADLIIAAIDPCVGYDLRVLQ